MAKLLCESLFKRHPDLNYFLTKAFCNLLTLLFSYKFDTRYGCRRFLRDGFRTAREDVNRLYYEPWELRMFDGIECEWPMFFAWLVIDASFREDFDDADRYMQMLQEVVIPEVIGFMSMSGLWRLSSFIVNITD